MINIENISKSYGQIQVLDDVSIELKSGRVYGIVGENGAGKTTFFRCIAGLESHSGNVKSDFSMLKNHMGLLETDPYFFSKITGGEYLTLVSQARGVKISDPEERNIFSLPLKQYASTYSTGMKKKLALTGILIQENDFFILDEPYNGVDIQSNILITEIIRKLKEAGKTILISSHIFSTLKDTCDEIYLLSKGSFTKRVMSQDFDALEKEMKEFTIGNILEKLNL